MSDFSDQYVADFPPTSLGGQKFAQLKVHRAEIKRLGAEQSEGSGGAKSSSKAKRVARKAMTSLMQSYSDTARVMEPAHPGISAIFRVPRNVSDEVLINAARAFVTAATPLKNEFIQHEMPATFIEDLADAIEKFEEATGSKNLNTSKRVSATAALSSELEQAMQLKRELDPIVRNKYRNNPAKLAAWESASRVERSPKRKATKKGESPQ
jgi:hypothetical protein